MKIFLIIALIMLIMNILAGGFTTHYVIEFWGAKIQHHPVNVPFLPCFVAGLFLGEFTIPISILTWMISFVL